MVLSRRRLFASWPQSGTASTGRKRFPSGVETETRAATGPARHYSEESQQALDKLIAAFGHRAAYEIGRVYAWDGDKKRSFEWLQRSVAQHEEIQIIKVDPLLHNLRQDPRYTALLKQVNLPVD